MGSEHDLWKGVVPLREIWLRGGDDRPDGPDDLALDDEPADLAAVHADDQRVSAMADPDLWLSLHADDGPDVEDRLFAMLDAWRSDIQAESARPLITVKQAMAALAAGKSARWQKRRFIPLAGAAAALVVAISGVAVGAKDAEPGDALWGVSKVLYTERAQSVEAAAKVKGSLAKAQRALASGRTSEAVKELAQAQTGLPAVRDQEGRDALVAQQHDLAAQAADAAPITPIVPDPTVPDPSTAQLPPMLIPPINPLTPPKPPVTKPATPDLPAIPAAPEANPPATDPPATDTPATDTPESPPSSNDDSAGGTSDGHHNAEGSADTGHSSDGSDASTPSSDQPSGGDGTSGGSQPVAQPDPPAPADTPPAEGSADTPQAEGSVDTPPAADTAQAAGSADTPQAADEQPGWQRARRLAVDPHRRRG